MQDHHTPYSPDVHWSWQLADLAVRHNEIVLGYVDYVGPVYAVPDTIQLESEANGFPPLDFWFRVQNGDGRTVGFFRPPVIELPLMAPKYRPLSDFLSDAEQ